RQGARFVCQRCGFEAHADHNAALNIKARGIELLRGGE
ncbi:zinc ribbon domain-containing protein, partial [Caballeronia mineralivorans]